jgi:hypothetical protein
MMNDASLTSPQVNHRLRQAIRRSASAKIIAIESADSIAPTSIELSVPPAGGMILVFDRVFPNMNTHFSFSFFAIFFRFLFASQNSSSRSE